MNVYTLTGYASPDGISQGRLEGVFVTNELAVKEKAAQEGLQRDREEREGEISVWDLIDWEVEEVLLEGFDDSLLDPYYCPECKSTGFDKRPTGCTFCTGEY